MTLNIIFITVILTILNTVLIISLKSNFRLLDYFIDGFCILNIILISHKEFVLKTNLIRTAKFTLCSNYKIRIR